MVLHSWVASTGGHPLWSSDLQGDDPASLTPGMVLSSRVTSREHYTEMVLHSWAASTGGHPLWSSDLQGDDPASLTPGMGLSSRVTSRQHYPEMGLHSWVTSTGEHPLWRSHPGTCSPVEPVYPGTCSPVEPVYPLLSTNRALFQPPASLSPSGTWYPKSNFVAPGIPLLL